MLTHELIQWAKESRQEPIFLKLNFNKAYGRIDWTCMFQVMGKLGMSHSFITMIRVLFYDAMVSIYINNQATEPFELHRGVFHGCPLVPYLFIITVKALNATVKRKMRVYNLKGIGLLQCNSQQIINQYADDTFFTVRTDETSVVNLVGKLHKFGTASSLDINWHKSITYWYNHG